MENINRATAQNAAPQNDWREDQTNAWLTNTPNTQNEELLSAEPYGTDGNYEERLYARTNDDPEDEDDEDEEDGDWGHVDPAEGNSSFPDSNDPSGPGSAV